MSVSLQILIATVHRNIINILNDQISPIFNPKKCMEKVKDQINNKQTYFLLVKKGLEPFTMDYEPIELTCYST